MFFFAKKKLNRVLLLGLVSENLLLNKRYFLFHCGVLFLFKLVFVLNSFSLLCRKLFLSRSKLKPGNRRKLFWKGFRKTSFLLSKVVGLVYLVVLLLLELLTLLLFRKSSLKRPFGFFLSIKVLLVLKVIVLLPKNVVFLVLKVVVKCVGVG